MTKKKLPKMTHRGDLEIGPIKIPCYVLDDGRRVLGSRAMAEAMGKGEKSDSAQVARFAESKSISPYLEKGSIGAAIVKFKLGSGTAHGFEAEFLNKLCIATLRSRKNGDLHPSQAHIASACEDLLFAFAEIGIIALIDEATGFQAEREERALRMKFKVLLSLERGPDQNRFPPDIEQNIVRLKGWRPDCKQRGVGRILRQELYEKFPMAEGDLLPELDRLCPKIKPADPKKSEYRDGHFHQHFSEDVGTPMLEKHIEDFRKMLRDHKTWGSFERAWNNWLQTPGQTDMFDPEV